MFGLLRLIPAPAKIWVMVGLTTLALAALGGVVYSIDKRGYRRCENGYAVASVELKDQARAAIIKSERRYDNLKKRIFDERGANPIAGNRTGIAIDSLH